MIASGFEHEERRQFKSRLVERVRNDRLQLWVVKAEEMERAVAIGDSRQLFRSSKETGIKNLAVSMVIVHSRSRRLNR